MVSNCISVIHYLLQLIQGFFRHDVCQLAHHTCFSTTNFKYREEEAAKLFRLCAEAWLNANERGKCAEYLGRAAKSMEPLDEDAAAADYLHAIDVMVPPDSDATASAQAAGGASS